ncbi:hypothetical protein Ancab_019350 [Ancistrocladus abbreviatus]
MKNRSMKDHEVKENVNEASGSIYRSNKFNKMKKNKRRLGGGGLSLEAFSNAKTKNNNYNPAMIKKKREFYKNAKYVSKYKKLKQQSEKDDLLPNVQPSEGQNESQSAGLKNNKNKNKKRPNSLEELYARKHADRLKALSEREACIKIREEERQRAEARRKASREKMFKKTQRGQPVMKYRIEHLLETIQGSTS